MNGHEHRRESDGSLLTGIRSRDPQTLDAIIREYLPQIVRAARAAGLNPLEADDAAQSTFMTFLEKADTFEGRSRVRTWLFGILFRKIMEVRRAADREYEADDIDAVIERRFDANGSWIRPPQAADADFYARQVREGINDCLEITPPKQRMAFVLREIEGPDQDQSRIGSKPFSFSITRSRWNPRRAPIRTNPS